MNRKTNSPIYLLLGVFILAHVVLYWQFGLVTQLESTKYINQADLLLKGQFPSASKYYYYVPIVLLIAAVKKLSLSYIWVALVQSFISAIAILLYYKGTTQVFNRPVALLSSLALSTFLPFFSWDFYLYSDSLFISFSLIFYYIICRFEKQELKNLFLLFGFLVVLIFTRPFGVLFIPPLFVYFLFSRYKGQKIKWLTLGLSVLFTFIMLLVIDKIFHGGEDMDAMKPFVEEHIICFVPTNPQGAPLDLKHYDNGIRDILYYIVHNPAHFSKLMVQRLYSFFSLTRAWYTTGHNLFITAFILPAYILFFFGLVPALRLKKNAVLYLCSLIVLYPLAATFQCDDWHGRFTMPILPAVFAIAAYGFLQLFYKFRPKIK